MRKSFLILTIVVVAVFAVWRARSAGDAEAADRLLTDRLWLDHIPRGERDTIQVFFANRKDAVGMFSATSAWRGSFEMYRYEANGSELRVIYPQTGQRERFTARARRCDESGMDLCLEVDGASRGVKKYYSRKGWEVEPGATLAAVEPQIDELRARLAGAP